MDRYLVDLEIAADGNCMAHVLGLPGCFVRAPTRDQAMARLPDAIRGHLGWLRAHGEAAPPADAPIETWVASEYAGLGPFDPGDAAALFPPDRAAIDPDGVEDHLRWMGYSRSDLMALIQELPAELLDWQPSPQSYSIRHLLRHLGNSEEWYVSRIVSAATLPAEWEDDEDLPILEFLEMERRTAVERLRRLTAGERSRIFQPRAHTDHPREEWTARKVLRRFLEHEREHTAQVLEILDARRRFLMSNLAAERASLLSQLVRLDQQALTGMPLHGDWTVKDLLAHVVEWDRWEHQTMKSAVAGEEPDFVALHDLDATNAGFVGRWRARSLGDLLLEMQEVRSNWVHWLGNLSAVEFFRRRTYSGDDWSFDTAPVPLQAKHDRAHAEQIAAWREANGLGMQAGHKSVLVAALAAAREELAAAAALVPQEERSSRPVCGVWTLKDLLGHVADWEWFCVESLRQFSAGEATRVQHDGGVDAWNKAQAAVRRDDQWQTAWDEFHAARKALLAILNRLSQADLDEPFPNPWDPDGTPYRWIQIFQEHDREHARDIRAAVQWHE
jgi:uncharacterized damage-inducible protein DinB/predicted RNase H-like HicB family nuclease